MNALLYSSDSFTEFFFLFLFLSCHYQWFLICGKSSSHDLTSTYSSSSSSYGSLSLSFLGSWEIRDRQMYTGKNISRWSVINFDRRNRTDTLIHFFQQLGRSCKINGRHCTVPTRVRHSAQHIRSIDWGSVERWEVPVPRCLWPHCSWSLYLGHLVLSAFCVQYHVFLAAASGFGKKKKNMSVSRTKGTLPPYMLYNWSSRRVNVSVINYYLCDRCPFGVVGNFCWMSKSKRAKCCCAVLICFHFFFFFGPMTSLFSICSSTGMNAIVNLTFRQMASSGVWPTRLKTNKSQCDQQEILPWTKKKPSWIRILWYRGIKLFDSAAELQANTACDCRDFTHRRELRL